MPLKLRWDERKRDYKRQRFYKTVAIIIEGIIVGVDLKNKYAALAQLVEQRFCKP